LYLESCAETALLGTVMTCRRRLGIENFSRPPFRAMTFCWSAIESPAASLTMSEVVAAAGAGLDWVEGDGAGVGVVAAAGAGLDWVEGDGAGVGVVEEDGAGLDWVEGDDAGLDWVEGDGAGLDWVEGDDAGLDWVEGDGAGVDARAIVGTVTIVDVRSAVRTKSDATSGRR
jgi:hypothetical protein